jgi:hypothetical protein
MPLINHKTVDLGGFSVTVHTSSSWAKIDARMIWDKMFVVLATPFIEDGKNMLRITDRQAVRLNRFVLMMVDTDSVSDRFPFPWPTPDDAAAELVRAFTQIGDCLRAEQIETWIKAIEDLDAVPGDPELAPDFDEGKKTQES